MATTDIVVLIVLALFLLFGAIKGFAKKLSGWASFFGAIIVGYYLTSPLLSWLSGMDFYASWQDSMGDWARIVLMILCFLIGFLVIFLVLKLIFVFINKMLEANKVMSFFNHLLGAIAGLLMGLLLVTIGLLICYGLGNFVESFQETFYEDIKFLDEEGASLSKWILEYSLNLIETLKTSGVDSSGFEEVAEVAEEIQEAFHLTAHNFKAIAQKARVLHLVKSAH